MSIIVTGNDTLRCSLLLYLHIPKNGGTSVTEVFRQLPGRVHLYLGDEKGSNGGPFRFMASVGLPIVCGEEEARRLRRLVDVSGNALLVRRTNCLCMWCR